MSGQKVAFDLDAKFKNYKLVIANQTLEKNTISSTTLTLEPWEALLYKSH